MTWRPRTLAAIAAARAAGIHVLIVTGRMYSSALPYALAAGITAPLVCYQGAWVGDPVTGETLLHEPVPLDLAHEVIAAVEARGFSLNCYVDDTLYVEQETAYSRRYSAFQHIPVFAVGPLQSFLRERPTKLVVVDEEARVVQLEIELQELFAGRLHVARSLPHFLEFSDLHVTKGSGLAFVAERLGFDQAATLGCGDGDNDIELLEWAGYAVAVDNATPRLKAIADWICPSVDEEGVAQVIEAVLARRG